MAAPVNQQISGLTVREGGKLFAGYSNTTNNIQSGPPKLLPYSTSAAFNAFGNDEDLCVPNTRVDILNQIKAWIDGYDGTNVFWLSGWAGIGKSIIARTISREYHDRGRRGENFFASFFFSRGREDVSDAGKFATSIAMQLANSPVLGERIYEAISDDDKIAGKILLDQWNQLIIEPLSKLDPKPVRTTLVLVIDALDECDKQGDIQRVIQLLANAGALQTIWLRVLLTSRPEPNIRDSLSHFLRGVYREVILHNISKSIVENDIFTFFNHKFERFLPTGWPRAEDIKLLVQKAAGLFIWAETAYRFICAGKGVILPIAKQRLHIILQSGQLVTKPEDELNKIYLAVLKNVASHDYDEKEKKEVYGMLRKIVGSIVLLFSPLSAKSLASLINFSGEDLRQTLAQLHSILEDPEDRGYPIRLHHPSFRDFFLDTKRCTYPQLQIDGNRMHWALASSCIRVMFDKLKKDICNLHLPGALAVDVNDKQIKQFIPEDLQYACSYWVQHLQKSKNLLLDNGEVHIFLQKHLLFWLEVISLLKKMSEGVIALMSLESIVKIDQSPLLYALIHDAKRFALKFRYVIEEAPLQIYCSALLFAPEMCLVRKKFESQIPKWINVRTRRQEYWSPALQTLEGHSHWIKVVVFSPDGKLIASASLDRTIKLWDSSTGAALQTLQGHLNGINALAFSPDGNFIASASRDQTIRLWDLSTGAALQTLQGHSNWVQAVKFSPDGKLIASASLDYTARLWDSSTGAVLQILWHLNRVTAVVFSPDGKLIASASGDHTVRLWDSSTGAVLQTLEGHLDIVEAVQFAPDGKLVASASQDKTARLWDSYTGAQLQILQGHSGSLKIVQFSPDGKLVASAAWDDTVRLFVWENTVRLWDSSTGVVLHILRGHSSTIEEVAFSPDGKIVASASFDKTVRLWDSSTGAVLQTLWHLNWVTAVIFSPDGKLIASACFDHMVRLWDSSTRVVLQTLPRHLNSIEDVVFSPDGKLVASASQEESAIRLWDSFTGAALQKLRGHSKMVNIVVFSPDGKLIASASEDNDVRLWDSTTRAVLQTLKGHLNLVKVVVFSPDGKLVASASQDESAIRLWDSFTGAALQKLRGHSKMVNIVVFSPNGKLIASASEDNDVRLWDSSTGAALQTLKGHLNLVEAVVFSPDGKLVASASKDTTVRLWDSSTGAALHTQRHSNLVNAVAFSPDGKVLASSLLEDKTVKLWDSSTGAILHTFEHSEWIYRLSFSQDGSYLKSDKGFLSFLPGFSDNFPYQLATIHLSLPKRWIVGTMGKLLWLPPEYEPNCSDVRNNSVVLGHKSGYISFFRFDLSQL